MPNWCYNNFKVSGPKKDIDEFESFLDKHEGKNWFDFFLPTPEELEKVNSPNNDASLAEQLYEKYGATDWYTWNVENWGCKWNCTADNWLREEDSISFSFQSPWSPPIHLYEFIEDHDLHVEASYLEEGMCFIGCYSDGMDDCYEYTDVESLDMIPESLVEEWNLREQLEDFEEWLDEDEENE